MRLVQVTIPAGKRETVLGTLNDEGIDYVVTDETSGRKYTALVYFPLPTSAVEPVLDELQSTGPEDDAYTVVVDAQTVISRRFEALEEEYAQKGAEEGRISRQELQTEASQLTPDFLVYVTMTVISAVVATAGLLLDSPAVVVGSMVIAPLIGPALAASVGTVTEDHDLFVQGVKYQALGVALAIASAAMFAWFVRTANLVPPGLDVLAIGEVSKRLRPDVLSLVIALAAGVAGVLSLATAVSVALVGVMIAAALIPPAAAVGIGLAWGLPVAAAGSTVLVLVNLLSVNLVGLVTLWYMGYRPEHWFEADVARTKTVKRVSVLLALVCVLSVFLGAITYNSYQDAAFENAAETEVEAALETEAYDELELITTTVEYDDEQLAFRQTDRVIVTLGRPADGTYPGLAAELETRLEDHTDGDVTVQLRFIDTESA